MSKPVGSTRPDLAVATRREGTSAVVSVAGEARADTCEPLRTEVQRLIESGCTQVLLGMAGLTFIDSASVGLVLQLDEEARERGGTCVLFGVPRIVQRVLDVTGMGQRLRVAKDEQAARGLG